VTRAARLSAFVSAAALAGCSILSRSPPLDVRYFSPEPATQTTTETHSPAPVKLQLGQLTSSANLRERIVHRESPVEVGAYETLRWTENPDAYVHRALVRALFEGHPIEHVLGGPAPTLDVELVAFEVLHQDKRWAGRVQLRYRLHDDRAVIASGVVTELRPAAGDGFDGAVTAVGQAMDAATAKLAVAVASRLSPPP
jgi:cholesterol transport system auxiliary component